MVWHYDAELLRATFEGAGYDVDTSSANLPGGGGSLTARRERGAEVRLITVDAGGRIKVTITRLKEESEPGTTVLAGATFRGISEATTAHTLMGQVASIDQLADVVRVLDNLPAPSPGGQGSGSAEQATNVLPTDVHRR